METGAELREDFSVQDVLVEDGAVVGVVGTGPGGRQVTERARTVVGADGRHSRIARAVGAEQYLAKPNLQYGYYSYWRDLPVDGFNAVARPDRGWGAFPTNDGLPLVVVGWPYREAQAYRSDVEGNVLATLQLAPGGAERVHAATFVGGAVGNVLRQPYGPGWALVGNAGYDKDLITAQGISDAFRDAELCAGALDDVLQGRRSSEEALSGYQVARDSAVLPMYEFTTQMATLAPHLPRWHGCWAPSRETRSRWTCSPASSPGPPSGRLLRPAERRPDHVGG
ncbi:MAG: NAD(P)/FAD-dependent oxidoreductase, partial [Actinomycetes bacterium]